MVHTALDAVIIGRDPHISTLIHLPAVGVENVVVVTDLREPLGADTTVVVVGKSVAAFHKARLNELCICTKGVPAVLVQQLRPHIGRSADNQRAVVLGVVVFAVQLIQAIRHLHTVNGKVQLTVFFDDLLDAMLQIRNEHLTICIEVVHTAFYAIVVCTNPHIGILVHLAAGRVENIVVVTDLRKALGMDIIGEVVSASINIRKPIFEDISIFIAPVLSRFQAASTHTCCRVHIAASGRIHQSTCSREDNAIVQLDQAVKYLSVLIAIIQISTIIQKAIAQSRHQACLLIKVIPCNILDIVRHRMCIAICHIAVNIQPVGTFLQGNKTTEPRFARDKVLGAVFIGTERASCHLSLIVEGIRQALDGSHAGIHGKVIGGKIVEIGFAIPGNDRLPAGNKRAETCIVMLAVLFKQARQLSGRNAVRAKIVPEFAVLARGIAGQLLHAGQRSTILIVAPMAFLPDPAVLAVLLQVERIREVNDRAEEMGAIVSLKILAVVVRIQTVLDLILLLLGQRFKHMEVRINVIAQITADRTGKHVVFIPGRVVVGDQLQTAEHTKRIRGSRIDRLRLTDEIADNCQFVIHNIRRRQSKVLVGQTQIGGVDRKALRRGQRDRDRGQRTDTLSKLKQEVPRSPPLLIAAGQHVKQCRQLFGNRHLGHIHSKGVGGLRRSVGIDQIIGLLLLAVVRVGDAAIPGQQAAAAGGVIEVEVGFIVLVEIRRDLCGKLQRLVDRRSLGLNSGFLIAVALSLGFLIGTRILLIDRCLEFRELAGKHRADRQRAQFTVRIRRKAEARDRARFGIVKYKLRLGGVDLTALQFANRSQRNLQVAKLHITGVDLDQISIISSFQRQLRRLAIDHIHALSGEFQFCRLNNMKGLGTQHAAVRSYLLDLYISQRFCGKHIVCQCADALIRHLQFGALRQIDRAAGRSNAGGLYRQLRTDSQVIIVCGNDSMIKHIGGLGGRHHQQGRADGALVAVRGPIDHRDRLGAFALCRKGAGSAAIQIDR